MAIYTIYVPPGCSVEQAWETIKRGEVVRSVLGQGRWVNVDDETGKQVGGQEAR